jgi:hypothetical protein
MNLSGWIVISKIYREFMDNLGTQEENTQIFKRLAAAVEGKQFTPIRGSCIAFFCSEDDRREPNLEARPPFVRFGVRDV